MFICEINIIILICRQLWWVGPAQQKRSEIAFALCKTGGTSKTKESYEMF